MENAIIGKIKVRHFSTNFGPLKNDLSGNTVDPNLQVSKNRQIAPFLAFLLTFVYSKCKRSSLRSQCWMRLFLWFLNTVLTKPWNWEGKVTKQINIQTFVYVGPFFVHDKITPKLYYYLANITWHGHSVCAISTTNSCSCLDSSISI